MKILLIICLMVFGGCLFDGIGTNQTEETANNTPDQNITAQESPTPLKHMIKTDVSREDFLGCWSSGNGFVVRITDGEIFLSTNSFRPVKYVENELEGGLLVLKLTNRPQFYFFDDIISLELNDDHKDGFPLTIKTYQNNDDYDSKKLSGHSGWVKDDCKKWFGDKER